MASEIQPETTQNGLSLWKLWPLPVAFFYAAVLNITYLMAWMRYFGVSDRWYFAIAFAASQSEMLWWNFFFGWLPKNVARMDFIQRRVEAFKMKGFPREVQWLAEQGRPTAHSIWQWFRDELDEMFNPPEGIRRRVFVWVLAFLRTTWVPVAIAVVFALGAVPQFNVLVGIPLCRALRHGSLLALMAGNTLTIYSNDKVVDLAFWLWRVLPVWAEVLIGVALVALGVVRHQRRKTRKQKAVS